MRLSGSSFLCSSELGLAPRGVGKFRMVTDGLSLISTLRGEVGDVAHFCLRPSVFGDNRAVCSALSRFLPMLRKASGFTPKKLGLES